MISGSKSHDKYIYIGHPLDGLSGAVSARDFRGGPRQQHPSMNNMTISLNSPDDAETKDIEAGHAPVLSCPVSLSGSKMKESGVDSLSRWGEFEVNAGVFKSFNE